MKTIIQPQCGYSKQSKIVVDTNTTDKKVWLTVYGEYSCEPFSDTPLDYDKALELSQALKEAVGEVDTVPTIRFKKGKPTKHGYYLISVHALILHIYCNIHGELVSPITVEGITSFVKSANGLRCNMVTVEIDGYCEVHYEYR